jgi:methylmalonyl-CoA mutase C-terminal domain/subunit
VNVGGVPVRPDGERPVRVIVSKVGLDGHDRGVKVIALAFRDAGMEVIYAGLRRTPDELAEILIQEDADVLGLSILSGAVVPLSTRVVDALRTRGLEDIVVLVGGVLSPKVTQELRRIGVDAAFGPGTTIAEMVETTFGLVAERRGGQVTEEERDGQERTV